MNQERTRKWLENSSILNRAAKEGHSEKVTLSKDLKGMRMVSGKEHSRKTESE